jgi:hypothetical protein
MIKSFSRIYPRLASLNFTHRISEFQIFPKQAVRNSEKYLNLSKSSSPEQKVSEVNKKQFHNL